MNLLLSLPPGFLANWLDYVRPLNPMSGPAWEMRYGGGGIHATVLPFRNFSIVGVFFVPFLYGLMIAKIEAWGSRNISVPKLSIILILIMCSPHWLWYGEKGLINALIIWSIMIIIFKLLVSKYGIYKKR